MFTRTTSNLPGMQVRPGMVFECHIPPSMTRERALCGRRPAFILGVDPTLDILVAPITSGVRELKLPTVFEAGIHGQVHVNRPRWIGEGDLYYPWPHGKLSLATTRRLLEAAREDMIRIGQRDLYRAAKRSL